MKCLISLNSFKLFPQLPTRHNALITFSSIIAIAELWRPSELQTNQCSQQINKSFEVSFQCCAIMKLKVICSAYPRHIRNFNYTTFRGAWSICSLNQGESPTGNRNTNVENS